MAESVIKKSIPQVERITLVNGAGSGTYQVDTTPYDFYEYIMLLGNNPAPRIVSGLTQEKTVRVSFDNNVYTTFTLRDNQVTISIVPGTYSPIFAYVKGYKIKL